MRTPIVAANWKMHNTIAQGLGLLDAMLPELQTLKRVERVICPPFTALVAVAERLRGTGVRLGAQNLHYESSGAYTGEVSPSMVAELAEYVIVGHSERRQHFGETDEMVNRKALAAQRAGLKPIICVGEDLAQNEAGQTTSVVERQVRTALQGFENLSGVVIAYEPIWAIGTGRPASPEGANQVCGYIRGLVGGLFGPGPDAELRIQYGGSVSPDNFEAFISQREIDGALVGGASLKADAFVALVREAQEAKGRLS